MVPLLPNRRTIRLAGYDYRVQGAYFLTVCARERQPVFGTIRNGIMCLNELGALVWREWCNSFEMRPEFTAGSFVVMPNHWHGIIHSVAPQANPEIILEAFGQPVKNSLASLMRGLKSSITSCARRELQWQGGPVCQSRYWDHVIRNEQDYLRIDEYIRFNPARWQADCFYSG